MLSIIMGSPVHHTLLQALAVGPEGWLVILLVEVLLDEGWVQLQRHVAKVAVQRLSDRLVQLAAREGPHLESAQEALLP